jgi:hypothetical protein
MVIQEKKRTCREGVSTEETTVKHNLGYEANTSGDGDGKACSGMSRHEGPVYRNVWDHLEQHQKSMVIKTIRAGRALDWETTSASTL